MDFRKTFDTISQQFDKWRPRYCDELFANIIKYADMIKVNQCLKLDQEQDKLHTILKNRL